MAPRNRSQSPNSKVGAARSKSTAVERQNRIMAAVIACFILSGFAALLYQTAWLREFSLVFGTSELAVATVLAAYMGGLALGAGLAGRFANRVTRPILVYGFLEAGIALSALAVPLLLLGSRTLYASAVGNLPAPPDAATIGQPVFYLIVAFVVLAVPTGLMGATLPLLTRYAVRNDHEVGPKVALLYATNTFGAVFGTLVAAFVLLPALGLKGTIWIGVGVNGLVFAIAASLARKAPKPEMHSDDRSMSAPASFLSSCIRPLITGDFRSALQRQRGWIMPLMLISGANAFLYEVLWTRMLAHVLGGSIYAFATMLAAFLTGIALGGAFAGKVAENRDRATIAFAVAQTAIAILSMGVYAWIGPLIPEQQTSIRLILYAVAVMLPATVFIGATFPLGVRILANDEREATVSTARIYSWNTFGAIAGAIFAGFYLLPSAGFEGSVKFAVCVNLGLALWSITIMAKPKPAFAGVSMALLVAAILAYNPSRPDAVVSSTGFVTADIVVPRELYYAVGRSSTVLLVAETGFYDIRTNGLPEAVVEVKGAPPTQVAEKWFPALAVTARPETADMLVIGFGGGVALEGIPPSVERVDVVELEAEVINANRVLEGMRNIDLLSQDRLNVVINDARNALRLTNKTYDAIISQPSHPWTAGASHLFTREFLAEGKGHLNDGGVFVQWMNSEFVDESLLRTLAATLTAEFEHVRLYHPSAQVLMFLASDAPLDMETTIARTGAPFTDDIMHYSRMGLNGIEDLFAALAMDEEGVQSFASGAPISTDNYNLMATKSRSRADGLKLSELMRIFEPYDPLLNSNSWIHRQFGNTVDYGYLARRLLAMAQQERVAKLADAIADSSKKLELYGLLYRARNETGRADDAFRAAVAADPSNLQARYLLLSGHLGEIVQGNAAEDVQVLAEGITDSAAAILRGWAYGSTGNWPALARLDAELARSRITDAWYPEAARLRAEWRTNVSQDPERFVFDALRLIERALLLGPEQNLFSLRAANSLKLRDDDRFLESARYLASYFRTALKLAENQGYSLRVQTLLQMRGSLAAIDHELSREMSVRDQERVRLAAGMVEELLESVDKLVARTN